MAIELMMVISMAMASDVVIIVFFVISRGMGVKKNEFFSKIRLKEKKMNFFALWKKVKLLFFKMVLVRLEIAAPWLP